MTTTASELQKALVSDFTDGEEYHYPPDWFWGELADTSPVELADIGRVESVTSEGGEGQGDSYYFVLRLTDADGNVQLFRGDGYYSSYDGVNWEGTELYEVEPREKVVIVYEAV